MLTDKNNNFKTIDKYIVNNYNRGESIRLLVELGLAYATT